MLAKTYQKLMQYFVAIKYLFYNSMCKTYPLKEDGLILSIVNPADYDKIYPIVGIIKSIQSNTIAVKFIWRLS